MCWQLTLSCSQIIAAAINRGVVNNNTTFAYRFPIGFQLLFPVLTLAGIWFVPESPRWLLRKGNSEKASASLRLLYHDNKAYDPKPMMRTIEEDLEREKEQEVEGGWLQLITDPIERRKVIYSAGALIAQQINGIQWFYYFGTVFSKAIGLKDPFLMTLIVFIIQVFVVLAAVLLANKLPRRPLLMITTGIMTVSIFVVGCLGIPGGTPSETIGKVIISFVIIEIVAFNFAWGPLGWTIVSILLLVLHSQQTNTQTQGFRNGCWPEPQQDLRRRGRVLLGHRVGHSVHSSLPLLLCQPWSQDWIRVYWSVFRDLGVCILLCRRGHRKKYGRDQWVLQRRNPSKEMEGSAATRRGGA